MYKLFELQLGAFSLYAMCTSGVCLVHDFFDEQKVDNRSSYKKLLGYLKRFPDNSGSFYKSTNAKRLKGEAAGFCEFRPLPLRLMYFYDGNDVICTHGFVKDGDSTPPNEIERVKDHYKIYCAHRAAFQKNKIPRRQGDWE